MYIVRLESGKKHSAWNTKSEALKQIAVLKNYGYRYPNYVFISGADYSNGQYFV